MLDRRWLKDIHDILIKNNTLHTISITLTRKQRSVSIYWSYFWSKAAQKEKNKINHAHPLIIKATDRYFSTPWCISGFVFTTYCEQHTKCVSSEFWAFSQASNFFLRLRISNSDEHSSLTLSKIKNIRFSFSINEYINDGNFS
jgi:hypothetical protein